MKIAIIGYGGMAHWHKEHIEEIEGLEFAGIWDTKTEVREKAEKEGVYVYGSQKELLEQEDITLVLVATPNDFHRPIAMDAMEKRYS